MSAEQLAFDFDSLMGAPMNEPLYYDQWPDPKTDRCRDCRRKVKGRYTQRSAGGSTLGHWMVCDDCIAEQSAIARANAPFYECGVHKEYFEAVTHLEKCLHNTCPFCGKQEPSSYLVELNHCPEAGISVRDGICMIQRASARGNGTVA